MSCVPECPLSRDEIAQVLTFEAERDRGLLHTPSYAYRMAQLRQKWEAWSGSERITYEGLGDGDVPPSSSVRVSANSPYVSGGPSTSQEFLDSVSEEMSSG